MQDYKQSIESKQDNQPTNKSDDIAQQEIHDVLIRYKQRLQTKLNNYEIGLILLKDEENN